MSRITGEIRTERFPTNDGQDAKFWPDFVTEEKIHCNGDRATLREILLIGMENVCHFGKRFTHYESGPAGVFAIFADGTTAKVMFWCEPMEFGRKVFLGLGAVKFPLAPNEAAKQFLPSASLKEQNDYLVCIVGGRHEHFPKSDKELRGVPAGDLQRLAADMLKEWPRQASSLVSSGDPSSFFVVGMYSTVPSIVGNPTNVTLLEDAVHAMTPTLGRGANLAMRDGALLGRQLKAGRRNGLFSPRLCRPK